MAIQDLNVGEEMAPVSNMVGKYQPIVYAGASGDFNAIHIDPEFGKMVGLGGNILHGLCTMAFVAKAVVDGAGGDPACLKSIKVRFANPVKPLETVVVHGKVLEKGADGIKLSLWADTKKGETQVITNGEAVIK